MTRPRRTDATQTGKCGDPDCLVCYPPARKSHLERTLTTQLRQMSLPEPVAQYRFAPPRRWAFDFAYPALKVGIECEGGTWSNGRHTRGDGYAKDCEKYNRAAELGWLVLRYTASMIESGAAVDQIERVVRAREGER